MGPTRVLGQTGRWPEAWREFPSDGASRGGTCFPRASQLRQAPGLLEPGLGRGAWGGGARELEGGPGAQGGEGPSRPARRLWETGLVPLPGGGVLGWGLGIPDARGAVGTEAVQGDGAT